MTKQNLNVTEIQNRIYDLIDKLDELTPKWAKSRADYEYRKEMKKVTLNVAKSASTGKTDKGKEQEAYTSEDYKKYLWKAFEVDCEYFSLEGKKSLLERELDAMRSLLSYQKSMIDITT